MKGKAEKEILDGIEKIFHDHSLKIVDMRHLRDDMGVTDNTKIYCGEQDIGGNPICRSLTEDYIEGFNDSYEELRKEIIEKYIKP